MDRKIPDVQDIKKPNFKGVAQGSFGYPYFELSFSFCIFELDICLDVESIAHIENVYFFVESMPGFPQYPGIFYFSKLVSILLLMEFPTGGFS